MTTESLERLLQKEREFWGAAGDPEFYRANFADEGVCLFPTGIMDKEAVIAATETSQPWREYTIVDPTMVNVADGVACLAYEVTARRTEGHDYHAAISSLYARRGDEWLLIVHQQTPM